MVVNITISMDELISLPNLKKIAVSKDIFTDEEIEVLKQNGIKVNIE